MQTDSLIELLAPYAREIEQYLRRWLTESGTPPELAEAMRYCVLDGGKRLRPALVLLTAEAAGASEISELTARAAVAVELIHCYSLVHDDLPSMDNDKLRRGRPTAHVRFGEAMAILVGDAILTRAFGVLGEAGGQRAARLASELARGAGPAGMVAGQVADVNLCDVPAGEQGANYIPLHKTAALIRAAARMGAICAEADDDRLQAISEYAESLGLAFQLIDDLLDVTGTVEILGKKTGKDLSSGKQTQVAKLGVDRTRELADELTQRAGQALRGFGQDGRRLRKLAELLAERNH